MFNYSVNLKDVAVFCCPFFLRRFRQRIEASPLALRLARGAFWSLTGAIISRGLMLTASVVIGRVLGEKGYGELGIIQSTVGMLQILAGFSLELTTTKYVAEFKMSDSAKTSRIIALSGLTTVVTATVMALLLVIFAQRLASDVLNAPHLATVLRVGCVMLFLGGLNGAQTGVLAGLEAFRTIARVNLVAGILSFPFLVMGVYLGGLVGAVWGITASLGANLLINHFALRKELQLAHVPFKFEDCWREWRILSRFSLPSVFGGVMLAPVTWICSSILVNQDNGYQQMGIFNAANQWRTAMLFLPGVLGQVALPMLTSLHGEGNRREYTKTLWHNLYINAAITLPIAAGASAGSWFIMRMYGEGFAAGYPVLILLSLSGVLMAVNNIIGQAIASLGKMWAGFAINLLWASVLISCTWLWRSHGAFGLALATVSSYVFHSVTCGAFGYKYILHEK